MRTRMFVAALVGAAALAGAAMAQQSTAAPTVEAAAPPPRPANPAVQIFNEVCAGCHGTTLTGARGPSLFREHLLSENTDDQLLHIVQNGIPRGGMPAFKDIYSKDQIRQVIAYMRVQSGRLRESPPFVPDPHNRVIESQKQRFRIEVVTAGLDTPWGMAFLPDGRMLVTERTGRLRIIDRTGKLSPQPVKGTPTPFVRQDGGYLDVVAHPRYARNGWIYLSYSAVKPGVTPEPGSEKAPNPAPPTMTVLVRGKLNKNNDWVEQQTIFKADPALYTTPSDHYGSRFLFDRDGRLFFTLGDRHNMAGAQGLGTPLGKIHRVSADGKPLPDNPFVHQPGAYPTVWSLGHRNPQGLAFHPVTGDLWETEHGPSGGDEINVIDKGANYGWGVVSMGLEPGITRQHQPDMRDPVTYFSPTVGPSGITFYAGDKYPGWKNNLFVATLAGQQLLRIETSGRSIVSQEPLFKAFGRVRDVKTGPDGLLYVLLQNPTGAGTGLALSAATAGMVIRLAPIAR